VRGRVAVPALHALFGGADVQRGELGIALDELAAGNAVTYQGADMPVQRSSIGPEPREHIGLLLGEHLDLTDVDRR
jgi:maltooligosyltrehalose synthase